MDVGWKFETYDVKDSDEIKESDGTQYTCPERTVLVGRRHTGDENGATVYRYARLRLVTPTGSYGATVTPGDWIDRERQREYNSLFEAPAGQVLIGRRHDGDENGNTWYQTGTVTVTVDDVQKKVTFTPGDWQSPEHEYSSNSTAPDGQVMVGRKHDGDENGKTSYRYATPTLAWSRPRPGRPTRRPGPAVTQFKNRFPDKIETRSPARSGPSGKPVVE